MAGCGSGQLDGVFLMASLTWLRHGLASAHNSPAGGGGRDVSYSSPLPSQVRPPRGWPDRIGGGWRHPSPSPPKGGGTTNIGQLSVFARRTTTIPPHNDPLPAPAASSRPSRVRASSRVARQDRRRAVAPISLLPPPSPSQGGRDETHWPTNRPRKENHSPSHRTQRPRARRLSGSLCHYALPPP